MTTITAVGMRFRGSHSFSAQDKITLAKEDENPKDPNAVKIMVDGRHVAYVAREDCRQARQAIDSGVSSAQFVDRSALAARLSIAARA